VGLKFQGVYRAMRKHLWLFLWPAFAVLVYSSVMLTPRYFSGFFVLGWVGTFVGVSIVMKDRKATPVILCVVAAALLAANYRESVGPTVAVLFSRAVPDRDSSLTRKLAGLGVRRGDEICVAGRDFFFGYGYGYARLLGARVSMAIPQDVNTLSKLPAAQVESVIAKLRANGARAVISPRRPAFDNDSGWISVPEFNLFIRFIQ
jgi:hypothetical protein